MDRLLNLPSLILGSIGGIFVWLFGAFDTMLYVLLAFIVIDYITGVIKGVYQKQLSSDTGFKGLLKKIMILAMVAVANLVQMIVGDVLAVREIVIMFFIANEGISIVENAAVLYPNIPQKLKDVLLQIRDKEE